MQSLAISASILSAFPRGSWRALVLGGQVVLFSLGACASAPKGSASHPGTVGREGAEVTRLADVAEAQERRFVELESRIALLEQEARSSKAPVRPTDTVRIGGREGRERASDDSVGLPPRHPVAVVRLHEEGAPARDRRDPEAESEAEYTLPVAPRGVPTSLEVVPLPEDRAKLEMQGATVEPRTRYRDALALLQARRYDEAIALLAALTREVPVDHPLAAQATYWKGEAHYAARRYREALIAFEAVIARFPTSAKVPDALLKAGLCNKRLGQDALAQRYFEQVRKEHPTSDAAQSAPREGSS